MTLVRMLAGCLIGLHLQSAAVAEPADNFFAGRQIKVIVTTQAGADYDLWMRFIAPYMSKYIPGAPTLIIQNMPGAGSIVGTNYLFNVAPRDGTTFGMIGRNLPFQAILGEKGIRFETAKFNWIGNPEVTNRVCAQRPIPEVKSAKDLFEHQVMIGGAGAGGALSTIPQLLSRMLGMRMKLVEGYQGPRDILLAIERGELNGVCMSVTAIENMRPGLDRLGQDAIAVQHGKGSPARPRRALDLRVREIGRRAQNSLAVFRGRDLRPADRRTAGCARGPRRRHQDGVREGDGRSGPAAAGQEVES